MGQEVEAAEDMPVEEAEDIPVEVVEAGIPAVEELAVEELVVEAEAAHIMAAQPEEVHITAGEQPVQVECTPQLAADTHPPDIQRGRSTRHRSVSQILPDKYARNNSLEPAQADFKRVV